MKALGLLVMLLLAPGAGGQETLFLRPAEFLPAAGAPVLVHLEGSEAGGKALPWDDSKVRWLFIRGQGTQENRDGAPGGPDATGAVALPGPPAGAAAAGVDFKPAVEEMDAAALRAFAAARCEEGLPKDIDGKVRVERRQSCKTLLRVGDEPRASEAAIAEGAQGAEIVTQMDPTRAAVGSDVLIEATIGGAEVEEARVIATCLATGKSQDVRIDDEHRGLIHIDASGAWRLEFHHLERAKEASGADWVLTSATLTFDVPEAKK
jgi:hypothetical protein